MEGDHESAMLVSLALDTLSPVGAEGGLLVVGQRDVVKYESTRLDRLPAASAASIPMAYVLPHVSPVTVAVGSLTVPTRSPDTYNPY